MKNKSLKLLFCTAVLSMVLTVGACGDKKAADTSEKTTPTPEVTEEVQPETTEAPEDTGNAGNHGGTGRGDRYFWKRCGGI